MKCQNKFSLMLLVLTAALLLTACAGPAAAEAPDPAEAAPKTRTVLGTMTMEIFMENISISETAQYSYDENGLLSQIITYSAEQEVSRTEVENDEHGEVIRQSAASEQRVTVTDSENTYDDAGNLIKKVDTVSVDGVITDIREYSYRPDGKHLQVVFTRTGENGYITSNTYEYDDLGNQIAVIQESNGFSSRTEAEFDETGRILRSVTTNSDGIITNRSEYDYAEDGTVTQTSVALPTGLSVRTVTQYDENGNTLSTETWTEDALTQRITCTYITVPAFK